MNNTLIYRLKIGFTHFVARIIVFSLSCGFFSASFAQPGTIDATIKASGSLFRNIAGFNHTVLALSIQPDGKMLVGGVFTHFNDTSVNRLCRLNADGSLDTTFKTGNGFFSEVNAIQLQPDGKMIVAGEFTSFNSAVMGRICRLNANGSLDSSFVPGSGFNNSVFSLAIQPDGKIIVAGSFTLYNGSFQGNISRLNPDGSIDPVFNTGAGFNGLIRSVFIQPDGKIIAGGGFTSYNGTVQNYISRINSNGSLDNSFTTGTAFNNAVRGMLLLPDGKIMAGGLFTSFNGTARNRVCQLNSNGTLVSTPFAIGSGFNSSVRTFALLPDGKMLVSGEFTSFNGSPVNHIIRLNTNGTIDNSFNISSGFNAPPRSLVVQPDGKLVAGGEFTTYAGSAGNYLNRINTGGSIDSSYNKAVCYGFIRSIALQSDQKIVVGGEFTQFNGVSAAYITRLFMDGSQDLSFSTGTGFNKSVNAIIQQTDGKLLVGGQFTSVNGVTQNRITRLNLNGSVDLLFNTGSGFSHTIPVLGLQSDGKILAGGGFTSFNGISRNRLIRLNNDGSVDLTFSIGSGFNSSTSDIVVQPDGKIIVGGHFTTFNGTPVGRICRLTPSGNIDPTFSTGSGFGFTGDLTVSELLIQPDGKIIAAGSFTNFNGAVQNGICRLNPDGSMDNSFNTGSGFMGPVRSIVLQPDGKILAGGSFISYNGTMVNGFCRINPNGSLDNTFNTGTGFISPQTHSNVNIVALHSDGRIMTGGEFNSYNGMPDKRLIRLEGDHRYTISGMVYLDKNNDCIQSTGEPGLSVNGNRRWIVRATSASKSYFTIPDTAGIFTLQADSGFWQVVVLPASDFYGQVCPAPGNGYGVELGYNEFNHSGNHFAFKENYHCSMLRVSTTLARLNPCKPTGILVSYANEGNISTNNASVSISFPDEILPISSTYPWQSVSGNNYFFNLGTLQGGETGTFRITGQVSCGALNNGTYCIKSEITPSIVCSLATPAQYSGSPDGSWILVSGQCINNTQACFRIINQGNSGTGNMVSYREWRLYEDNLLVIRGSYKINGQGDTLLCFSPGGKTLRLEADQHPQYPGYSYPRASIERCDVTTGNQPSLGQVLLVIPDNSEHRQHTSCRQLVISQSPFIKQVIPEGLTQQKYIDRNDPLEYLIHAQNAGSGMLNSVIMTDSLDIEKLDAGTLVLRPSTHPYEFRIERNGIMTWTFSGINLPDSSVDEPGSHLFAGYYVKQNPANQHGDKIFNRAEIMMGTSSGNMTNQVFNTIWDFSGQNPLPVEFSTFEVRPENKAVSVMWSTNPDVLADFYIIERSHDGKKISESGKVLHAEKSSYTYIDTNPLAGLSYYRIKKVSKNGRFTYSKWLSVKMITGNINVISVVTANDITDVSFFHNQDAYVNWSLIDVTGRIHAKGRVETKNGTNQFRINHAHISPGIYFIMLSDKTGVISAKAAL